MSGIAWFGYLLFLGLYAWWKYQAAAPDDFSVGYARTVAILVGLTGVAPFLLAFLLLKAAPLKRFAASIAGVALGIVFCVGGYALFWKLFIAPYGGPEMLEVALRGVGWGALQGGLAAIAANH